jgi:hypothetical protein
MNCNQGDLAIIVESIEGVSTGKIVQCIRIQGDHSLYGPIWKVRSKDTLVSEHGGVGNEVDVPDKWLKPIRGGELDQKTEIAKLTQSTKIKELLDSITNE